LTDRKPPRAFGDDRTTLVALLQYLRESVVRKVEGVCDEDARRSPVPTGTSLLWLVKHLARAEALWFLARFAGQQLERELVDHDVGPDDTLEGAIARYRAIWEHVDAVIAASDLDTICAGADEEANPDLRWVIAHLLEETARHAGHADILRELIDGRTGR
jgi:Protein of unknown function (DUF664)